MPRQQVEFCPGVCIIKPNTDVTSDREPGAIWRIHNVMWLAFTEARFGSVRQSPSGVVLGKAVL